MEKPKTKKQIGVGTKKKEADFKLSVYSKEGKIIGKFTYDFSLFTVNRKFKIGFFLFCTYPNLFFRFGFFHYYFSSSLLSASAASRLLVSVVLWLIIFSSGALVVG